MGTLIAVIAGIVMLMILVVIHELGHFWAAKKLGVKVLEFGVGIPPKVKTLFHDKDGTAYTFNAIPLGGFVRLKGEDPNDDADFLAKDSLITASLRRKIIILLGGVFMNFVAAYLLFVIVLMIGVKPIQVLPDTFVPDGHDSYLMPASSSLAQLGYVNESELYGSLQIQSVLPESIAGDAGLTTGDIVLYVDGKDVTLLNFSQLLQQYANQTFSLVVQNSDLEQRTVSITCDDPCLLGVMVASSKDVIIQPVSLGSKAWTAGWDELVSVSNITLKGLGKLGASLISLDAKKTKDGLSGMMGPAGAIKVGQKIAASNGVAGYLGFAGIISLSLALFNLLPIPALDGGRIVGSIIQAIGRFKPQKYFVIEGYINTICFVLLMGLGLYILGQDLIKVWGIFG